VQIKPWPTHQNNRCWITCWRSHCSRSSPASKDCSKCRACRGADLQSGGRTWHPQESSGNWAANICTLGLLFVADVIRDELFAGVQHMIFFQVVCLRQSCWSYVAPSSVLSVYYDKICIKFALHYLLLYVVYMCQKSLNFTNVTSENGSGFTLAGPPCRIATVNHPEKFRNAANTLCFQLVRLVVLLSVLMSVCPLLASAHPRVNCAGSS